MEGASPDGSGATNPCRGEGDPMTTRPHAIGPFFGLFLLAACSCNDEVQSAKRGYPLGCCGVGRQRCRATRRRCG